MAMANAIVMCNVYNVINLIMKILILMIMA
jgi:hypothetical protein